MWILVAFLSTFEVVGLHGEVIGLEEDEVRKGRCFVGFSAEGRRKGARTTFD